MKLKTYFFALALLTLGALTASAQTSSTIARFAYGDNSIPDICKTKQLHFDTSGAQARGYVCVQPNGWAEIWLAPPTPLLANQLPGINAAGNAVEGKTFVGAGGINIIHTAGQVTIDGSGVAGAGGGAPTTATYITQTPDAGLSTEQALSTLSTGILKNTTGTGVLSIATAGTDYLTPTGNGSGLTSLNASNLGSGTVPTARLGSGTANSSAFLRGDSTWQTLPVPGGTGAELQYRTGATSFGATFLSHSANGLAFNATPTASATKAYFNLGTADLAGGSSSGTMLGANPATFAGNFLDFQVGGSSKFSVSSAGTLTAADGIVSAGYLQSNSHTYVGQANWAKIFVASFPSDIAGTISLSASTSASFTLNAAHTSAPVCTVTPTSDPGSGVRYWVTATTSAVTVTTSSAVTKTFNFHCFYAQ